MRNGPAWDMDLPHPCILIPQSSYLNPHPSSLFMRKQTLQFLYASLAAAVLLLLSIGVFTFRSLRSLIEQSDAIAHTNKVLFQTEEVISTMKDAEIGQRGFILTHDSSFLKPYVDATQYLGRQLKLVDSLTNFRPQVVQRQRVRRLFYFAQQRDAHIKQLLAASLEPNRPDYDLRLIALLNRGKATMDSARIVVDSLQQTEKLLLEERIHHKDQLSANTLGLFTLISLLAVLMFSLAFYLLIQEIRRRQNYERQLEKTVSDLLRTNQDLEQFTYVVSHHLQEPLRKLQTFSTRLVQKHAIELGDNARFLMERMGSTANQMQTLMADLLVYTGLGLHGDTTDFEVQDLAVVFQKTVENHEKQLSAAKAMVQFDKQSWPVLGEMEQLELLFSHLLQNSLKFVVENQRPHISVHTFVITGEQMPFATQSQHDERFVKIVFTDNGIGIDMQYQDKVFGLFQRLHTADNYPGTGVGLAVCKRIVKRHNGSIHLAATEVGAAFHIYLPLAN